jgi:hypothetical protein
MTLTQITLQNEITSKKHFHDFFCNTFKPKGQTPIKRRLFWLFSTFGRKMLFTLREGKREANGFSPNQGPYLQKYLST